MIHKSVQTSAVKDNRRSHASLNEENFSVGNRWNVRSLAGLSFDSCDFCDSWPSPFSIGSGGWGSGQAGLGNSESASLATCQVSKYRTDTPSNERPPSSRREKTCGPEAHAPRIGSLPFHLSLLSLLSPFASSRLRVRPTTTPSPTKASLHHEERRHAGRRPAHPGSALSPSLSPFASSRLRVRPNNHALSNESLPPSRREKTCGPEARAPRIGSLPFPLPPFASSRLRVRPKTTPSPTKGPRHHEERRHAADF